jgi:hypothetical protein
MSCFALFISIGTVIMLIYYYATVKKQVLMLNKGSGNTNPSLSPGLPYFILLTILKWNLSALFYQDNKMDLIVVFFC